MAITGSGTQADPYIISSASDLRLLSGTGISTYGVDKYYELGADIDMSGVSFTPIGTTSVAFAGNFDGKNHTLSNKYSSGGLFALVRNAVIKNINIDCSYSVISYASSTKGILINSISNGTCTVSNIAISNSIIYIPENMVGIMVGVVSNSTLTISNCTISNCYGVANNEIGGYIGIVSDSSNVTISNSIITKSTIATIGTYGIIGGIVSKSSVNDSSCVIDGCTVSDCSFVGNNYVAGVVYQ